MKDENKPRMSWRVTIVAPKHTSQVLVTVLSQTRDGDELALKSWVWESGRPTPAQILDLTSFVSEDLALCIVGSIGVQGVL